MRQFPSADSDPNLHQFEPIVYVKILEQLHNSVPKFNELSGAYYVQLYFIVRVSNKYKYDVIPTENIILSWS